MASFAIDKALCVRLNLLPVEWFVAKVKWVRSRFFRSRVAFSDYLVQTTNIFQISTTARFRCSDFERPNNAFETFPSINAFVRILPEVRFLACPPGAIRRPFAAPKLGSFVIHEPECVDIKSYPMIE